jgi:hypothetical protein
MARNSSLHGSIRKSTTSSRGLVFAVVIAVLTMVVPLGATNANYRLCFTPVVGLPITNPNQPPTINGVISGDPGWTQAFRYVWANGMGSLPNAALQGIRDNTFLYLAIEVNNDAALDNTDLVILTFSPTDGVSPTDDRRIHIYPFRPDAAKGTSYTVEYWKDSSTWNIPGATQSTLPAMSIAVSSSGSSPNFSWIVEMAIPLVGFDIPATGKFGFYANVFRVGTTAHPTSQYFWPSNTGNGVQISPEQHTPATTKWGDATQDPTLTTTCKGVSLAASDITSDHSLYEIDARPGQTNTFTAKLNNTSVDPSGCPIAANQVTAKFSVANFGLPSNWTAVPNQNQGAKTIPAGSLATTPPPCAGPVVPGTDSISSSPPWDASGNSANYQAHPDQCILVDLDSTAPSCIASPNNCVSLLNKSVKRNMWVLTASRVSKTAEISTKGYGPPPAGRTQHEFELRVSSFQEVLKPGEPAMSRQATGQQPGGYPGGNKDRVVSRLTWAVNGCRLTGQYITIKGETYELCDDVGAFGAIVEHFGPTAVENWLTSLEGNGLTHDPAAKDTYRLRVPPESIATVAVRFAADEKTCMGTGKSGGASILLLGVFLVGFLVHRPRRARKQS